MEPSQSIQELSKIKIDCMYGKKKHYNASQRYSSYHRNLGIIIVLLTSFMGTSVFYSLSEDASLVARVIAGILVVADALLAGIQTFFNFSKRSMEHKVTADRYLSLMKKSGRCIAYYEDKAWGLDKIIGETEHICSELQEIQRNEPITSEGDYGKAKKGIDSGEEDYNLEESK